MRVVWSQHLIFTVTVNSTPPSHLLSLHPGQLHRPVKNKLLRAFRNCLCWSSFSPIRPTKLPHNHDRTSPGHQPTGSYRQTHLFDQQAYMHATRLCFEIAVFQACSSNCIRCSTKRLSISLYAEHIPTYTESRALQVAYNTNTPQGVRKWLCSLIALYLPLVPPCSSLTGSNSSTSATTDDWDARLHSEYIHWYKYIDLFNSQIWNVYGMSDIMINICESEGFHYALN